MHVQRQGDVRRGFFGQVGVLGGGRGDALIPGIGLVAGLGGSEVPTPRLSGDPHVPAGVGCLVERATISVVALHPYASQR